MAHSSAILLGGSLRDRFGRRRVFVTGSIWFAVASAL
jgi:MFS family permease